MPRDAAAITFRHGSSFYHKVAKIYYHDYSRQEGRPTGHCPLFSQWLYRNSLELRRAHRASSRPSFRLLAFVTPSRNAAVSSGVGCRLSAARYRCSTISSFVRPACKSRPSTPRSLRILAFRVSPPTRSSNWVRLVDCLRVQVAFSRLGRSKIVRKYESTIGSASSIARFPG